MPVSRIAPRSRSIATPFSASARSTICATRASTPSPPCSPRIRLPPCSKVTWMSGRAIARRRTTSRQAAYFAARRAQELAPRGDLAEQVLDPHPRARRQRGGPVLDQRAVIDRAPPAFLGAPHAAFERQPGDAGDRRQRLAAEAERGDQLDRVVGQLRGRVAFERERHVGRRSSRSRRRSPRSARARLRPARPRSALAPASIAFSTSSLSAEAGRSTTSPAAMRLTSVSGRRRIVAIRGW